MIAISDPHHEDLLSEGGFYTYPYVLYKDGRLLYGLRSVAPFRVESRKVMGRLSYGSQHERRLLPGLPSRINLTYVL